MKCKASCASLVCFFACVLLQPHLTSCFCHSAAKVCRTVEHAEAINADIKDKEVAVIGSSFIGRNYKILIYFNNLAKKLVCLCLNLSQFQLFLQVLKLPARQYNVAQNMSPSFRKLPKL